MGYAKVDNGCRGSNAGVELWFWQWCGKVEAEILVAENSSATESDHPGFCKGKNG